MSGARERVPSSIAIIQALAAAALFGASTPLAKVLVGQVDPWMLAALLYVGSGVSLAAFALLRPARVRTEVRMRRADAPWLAATVVAGGIAAPVLLMYGLARSDAASAALLLNLEGIATMVIAWLVFREHVDRRLLLGAFAIVAGAVALSWTGCGLALQPGALAIAAACIAWGLDNNLTRRLSDADPVQIALIKGLVAGVVNLGLAFAAGAAWPSAAAAFGALIVGAAGYGLSLVLFILALRGLGAARTGAYFSTAPFVGAAVAVLLFELPITLELIAAAVLMGSGVYLHLSERHDHEHAHDESAHEHRHDHEEHHEHVHDAGDPPGETHSHAHRHAPLVHSHPHYPDTHHRHRHG